MPDASDEKRDGETTDAQRKNACGYIADLLGNLQKIADSNQLPMLAHLIHLARHEAKHHC
jgi:hypothetical protein